MKRGREDNSSWQCNSNTDIIRHRSKTDHKFININLELNYKYQVYICRLIYTHRILKDLEILA